MISLNGTGQFDVSNRSVTIYSVKPDFITQWRSRKEESENLCKQVLYNLSNSTELCKQIASKSQLIYRNDSNSSNDWNKQNIQQLMEFINENGNFANFIINSSSSSSSSSSSLLTRNVEETSDGPSLVLPPFQLWQTILIAFCLALCILLTVGGNILVLLAFMVDRNIRQPSNYFIASLAATDVLIGTVSMPFYTIYVLMGYWNLGPLLCDLWLSVDYTVCLVSQYTVLLITIDRYCSVKIAAKYRSWRTKRRVLYMVTITWIIPALLFFISIFGWEHFTGKRDLLPGQCAVQFLKDPIFNTALIIGYYWTTLIVLFILYGGIYKTAYEMQKRSDAKHRKMQSMVALSAGTVTEMTDHAARIGVIESATILKTKIDLIQDVDETTSRIQTNSSGPASEQYQTAQNKTNTESKIDKRETDDVLEKSERSSSPTFDSDEGASLNQHHSQRNETSDNQEAKQQAVHKIESNECYENDASILSSLITKPIPPPEQFRCLFSVDEPTSSSDIYMPSDILINNSDFKYMDETSIVTVTATDASLSFSLNNRSSTCNNSQIVNNPNSVNTKNVMLPLSSIKSDDIKIQNEDNHSKMETYMRQRIIITADDPNKKVQLNTPAILENVSGSHTSTSDHCHTLILNADSNPMPALSSATNCERITSEKYEKCDESKVEKQESFTKDSRRRFISSVTKRLKDRNITLAVIGVERQKSKSENRARKAFRTISFILGCFVACWTPYHVLALVEGFCTKPPCTNEHLYMFSYFLCYANSPMNPFCYALANQQFKKTFTRILKGDLHRN